MHSLAEYYIPNHVHFACEGDIAVFLDLREDQYSMLFGTKARAFNAILTRTPEFIQRQIVLDNSLSRTELALHYSVVEELLRHRLLTTAYVDTERPVPAIIPLPEENLLKPADTDGFRKICVRDVRRFIVAYCVAQWRLAFQKIERTVRLVERRNLGARRNGCANLVEARNIVRTYNRLRLLVPRDSLCLFDSLALLEFLAQYGHFPNWVFAVKFDPWMAHCWVQYKDISFNQDMDEARTYLPIMSV